MRFGFNETCLEHDPGPRHPENPDRLRAIREHLKGDETVEYVSPDPATEADVVAVHSEGYVDELKAFIESGGGNWDPDTAATETTWDASLASAGIAIWAAKEALAGASGHEMPFALGRPPGHHATPDDAMGFCFFNNAGIAAQYALDSLGADRVAILDWDVHHGNGTQDMFYDRGTCSTRRFTKTDSIPGPATSTRPVPATVPGPRSTSPYLLVRAIRNTMPR